MLVDPAGCGRKVAATAAGVVYWESWVIAGGWVEQFGHSSTYNLWQMTLHSFMSTPHLSKVDSRGPKMIPKLDVFGVKASTDLRNVYAAAPLNPVTTPVTSRTSIFDILI